MNRADQPGPHRNWDRIEGNWKNVTGKVRERWGKLTDDELDVIQGKREQLEGRIQEAYGIGRDGAPKQVEEFAKSL
ncbi:MAG TPA: CsbD family protein [Planctomycetota bacterium]|nr:CsbD family protein [Planctomycetota bacterium]